MKNSVSQAVRQQTYNSWVLNGIILGTILAILTAVLLPVGRGSFFGIVILLEGLIIAIGVALKSIPAAGHVIDTIDKLKGENRQESSHMFALFFLSLILVPFLHGALSEIKYWGMNYSQYREALHSSSLSEPMTSFENISAICYSFVVMQCLSFWMILRHASTPEEKQIDFFLVNPACSWFPWKRKTV